MLVRMKHTILWVGLDRKNGECCLCGPVRLHNKGTNRSGTASLQCSTRCLSTNREARLVAGIGGHAPAAYGITKELYRMMTAAGRPCAVCKEVRRLCLDHRHRDGLVRDGVCHRCNIMIGFIENRPAHVQSALAYIATWETIQ